MNAAVYARVSTAGQEIDRQLEQSTEYLLSRGHSRNAIEYYRDTGTGGNTDRDGFQRLMTDAEADEIDVVAVHELSRLSRSMTDLAASVDRLKDAGVTLHVVDRDLSLDPADTDPMTEAFFYLMGVFAQLERDMIRGRVRSGIQAAQEAGKHTGKPPYGFDTDSDGYLTPNENYETAVVALERLDAGDSKRSVANATGISRRTLGRMQERREMYETQ